MQLAGCCWMAALFSLLIPACGLCLQWGGWVVVNAWCLLRFSTWYSMVGNGFVAAQKWRKDEYHRLMGRFRCFGCWVFCRPVDGSSCPACVVVTMSVVEASEGPEVVQNLSRCHLQIFLVSTTCGVRWEGLIVFVAQAITRFHPPRSVFLPSSRLPTPAASLSCQVEPAPPLQQLLGLVL